MKLVDINERWNRAIKYKAEPQGKDHWQNPSETIALGTGDCEDYAIGKYFTLLQYYVDLEFTHLVTVRMKDGRAHCMLYTGQWCLDNMSKEIVPHAHRWDVDEVLYRSCITDLANSDPRFVKMVKDMDRKENERAIDQFFKVRIER